MASQEFNLIFKLNNQVSGNLAKINKDVENLGKQMQRVGTQMNMAGRQMMYLGGIVTGAFGVALKNAAEYSNSVRAALDKVQVSLDKVQVEIAQAVLPVVQQFANIVANLAQKFNELDPQLKEHVLQLTLVSAAWVMFGGTITRTLGSLLRVVGLVVRNPWLLLLATATAIVVAQWERWQKVIYSVANAIEIAVSTVLIGFNNVQAFMLGIFEKIARAVGDLEIKLSRMKMPQGMKKWLQEDAAGAYKLADGFKSAREEMDKMSQTLATQVISISKGGKGTLQKVVDEIKKIFDGLSAKTGEVFAGMKKMMDDLAQSMRTSFSNVFYDMFTGQLKKAQDYFAEFGKAILRNFSDMLAEMVTRWIQAKLFMDKSGGGSGGSGGGLLGIATSVLGLFGGGGGSGKITGGVGGTTTNTAQFGKTWSPSANAYHSGGIVRAHGGLAVDEVPIIAQRGEGVLSRRGMAALGRGGFERLNNGQGSGGVNIQPVVVFNLMSPADVARHKDAIEAIVSNSISNNGQIRKIIREYS